MAVIETGLVLRTHTSEYFWEFSLVLISFMLITFDNYPDTSGWTTAAGFYTSNCTTGNQLESQSTLFDTGCLGRL